MNVTQILTSKFIRHTGNNDIYVTGNPMQLPNKDVKGLASTLYIPYSSLNKEKDTVYLRKTDDFEKFEHAEFDLRDYDVPPKFSIDFKDYRIVKVRGSDGNWTTVSVEAFVIFANTTFLKPLIAD